MRAKHAIRFVVEPRRVAKLGRRRPIQRGEQRIEQRDVLLPGGWKLQKHRTQSVAQQCDALAEDAREPDPIETFG